MTNARSSQITFASPAQVLTDHQIDDLNGTAERNDHRGAYGTDTHNAILAITGSSSLSISEKIRRIETLTNQLKARGDIAYLQTHRAVRFIRSNVRVARIR